MIKFIQPNKEYSNEFKYKYRTYVIHNNNQLLKSI